jgi:hypothetical protein
MTAPAVGENVKVRYDDSFKYTLDVEVMAIRPPDEFVGRVKGITSNRAEVTGGHIFDELKGQERTFRNDDIVE